MSGLWTAAVCWTGVVTWQVVQVYLSWVESAIPVPRWTLVGFQRVTVALSATHQLSFTITARQMSAWIDDSTGFDVQKGNLTPVHLLTYMAGKTLSSVLWHCWLGVSKVIWPVKIEWWGVVISVWSEVQIVCISSWCHCIPKPHHLLPHSNSDWFYLSGTGLPRLFWKRGP